MALEDIDGLSEKELNAQGHVDDHKKIVRGLKGVKGELEGRLSEDGLGNIFVPATDARLAALVGTPRINLVKNPRLGINSTGWALWAGTGGTATSNRIADGDGWAFRISWTTGTSNISGEAGPGRTNTDDIPVTPGDVITASLEAEVNRIQRLRCVATFYNAANATVGSIAYGASQSVSANVRTRIGVANLTVPANAVRVTVRISSVSGTDGSNWQAGDTLLVTKALSETSSTIGTYFDGSTPGASWNGTPDDSSSTSSGVREIPTVSSVTEVADSVTLEASTRASEDAARIRPTFASLPTTGTAVSKNSLTYRNDIDLIVTTSTYTVGADPQQDRIDDKIRPIGNRGRSIVAPTRAVTAGGIFQLARAMPRLAAYQSTVSWLGTGVSLTTALGAGFTEYAHDTPNSPLRTRGLYAKTGTNSTVSGLLFQRNVIAGDLHNRSPFSIDALVTVTGLDQSMVLTYCGNQSGASNSIRPGIGIELDGEVMSPSLADWMFYRDLSGVINAEQKVKITLKPGTYPIRLDLQSMDWRSLSFSQGITVTPLTNSLVKIAMPGNSWIEQSASWGAGASSIGGILGRLLGGDTATPGQGGMGIGSGGTGTGKYILNSPERLDPIIAFGTQHLIVGHYQQDDVSATGVQAATSTAEFTAALTSMLSYLATNAPNLKVWLFGPEVMNINTNGNRKAITAAAKAVAITNESGNIVGSDLVAAPYTEKWVSGNRTDPGWGSADFEMYSGDTAHPNGDFGVPMYAVRMYESMRHHARIKNLAYATGYGFNLGI